MRIRLAFNLLVLIFCHHLDEPSEVSAWIHAFLPLERFSSVCMNVYFVEDFSESDFILTNAGLLYLFFERAQRSTDKDEREDLERYIPILQGNLETALANLPFHLPLTSSMISALLLGVCDPVLECHNCYRLTGLRPSMLSRFRSHRSHGHLFARPRNCVRRWDTIEPRP